MAAAPKLMTVEEYFRTPETLQPTELVFGVMRVADAPTSRHQAAVGELFFTLTTHVRGRGLGTVWVSPLDVVLDEPHALIVQPDLLFISNERAWIVRDRVMGAPDLVIEVLSPNPRIGLTDERVAWFAEYGVRECWLVHQDRKDVTIVQFANRRTGSQDQFGSRDVIQSAVLPDFSQTLESVFAAEP